MPQYLQIIPRQTNQKQLTDVTIRIFCLCSQKPKNIILLIYNTLKIIGRF